MNFIFECGQSGQDLYLGIFRSLLIILVVEIFIGTSPKPKHWLDQILSVYNSSGSSIVA